MEIQPTVGNLTKRWNFITIPAFIEWETHLTTFHGYLTSYAAWLGLKNRARKTGKKMNDVL